MTGREEAAMVGPPHIRLFHRCCSPPARPRTRADMPAPDVGIGTAPPARPPIPRAARHVAGGTGLALQGLDAPHLAVDAPRRSDAPARGPPRGPVGRGAGSLLGERDCHSG